MSEDIVLKLAKDALSTVFMIAGPLLVVSLVVGISVSIAQVVTSIQDMTLSFVPRIIAVFIAFLLIFPWIMKTMLSFTTYLLGNLSQFAR